MKSVQLAAIAGFIAVYSAALYVLDTRGAFPLEEALMIFVIIGIGFTAVGAGLTYGLKAPALTVHRPRREAAVALALCVLVAGFLVWGQPLVDAAFAGNATTAFTVKLIRKLVVFVLVPYAVFRLLFGYRLADFGFTRASLSALWGRQGAAVLGLSAVIMLFQFFAGSGAAPIRNGVYSAADLGLWLPVCFAWLVLEVGLVEEFLFRILVLERLTAALGSAVAGVVVSTLIFGAIHAPGYVLRHVGGDESLGANPDWSVAIAYTLAVPAVAGIFLSVLWLRTRNPAVVMLVHAATDLLPNFSQFMTAFGRG